LRGFGLREGESGIIGAFFRYFLTVFGASVESSFGKTEYVLIESG
jgi:hypothetical protein